MQERTLGTTGLGISAIGFGAGPVSALCTDPAAFGRQRATIERALSAGINWFDTAATYGHGESEKTLGRCLEELGALDRVHVGTKVRIPPERADDLAACIRESVEASLFRLKLKRLELLQLHNSITLRRGDQPTSLSVHDVFRDGGVLETFQALRRAGKVIHFGLTGLGDFPSLLEVLRSGEFATVQTPYHLLNQSAGGNVVESHGEANYGPLFAECAARGMGTFAIRVLAGGALAGQPPSAHTHTTKFFPLDLYHRDERRAAELARSLPEAISLKELAIRFVLSHRSVTSALIGFASPEQVDEVVEFAGRGALPPELLAWFRREGIRTQI